MPRETGCRDQKTKDDDRGERAWFDMKNKGKITEVEEQDKKSSIDSDSSVPAHRSQRDEYGTKRVKPAGRRSGWPEKHSGVERSFRSVVAPMQAAKLSGTAWSHHHLHPSGPSKALSHARLRLFWTVGRCWVAEHSDPFGVSSVVLFLHLRLRDVPEPCILVFDATQPGQEQEIAMHTSQHFVIDVDHVVALNLYEVKR